MLTFLQPSSGNRLLFYFHNHKFRQQSWMFKRQKASKREKEQCQVQLYGIDLRLLGLIRANGDDLVRFVLLRLRMLLRIIDHHLLLSG